MTTPGRPPVSPENSRAILRMSIISGVLLGGAVLIAFVFPIFDSETTKIAVVAVAALLSGANVFLTIRRLGPTAEADKADGAEQGDHPAG